MLKQLFTFMVLLVLLTTVATAQDAPKENNSKTHTTECSCEKCEAKASSDETKSDHPKECTCEKCDAKAKMAHSEKMDHEKMNSDHPENCSCDKCKSHANMDHGKKMEHHGEEMETSAIWNKFCPVGLGEVDPESPTVEYEGKTIGFCCPGCETKFAKDPEKYLKNLTEDGQELVEKS